MLAAARASRKTGRGEFPRRRSESDRGRQYPRRRRPWRTRRMAAVALADGKEPGAARHGGGDSAVPKLGARPALCPRPLQRRHVLLRSPMLLGEALKPVCSNTPVGAAAQLDECLAQPRAHPDRSRRRRIHARPAASDDRSSPAQRADSRRGRGPGDRGDPARRRARQRLAPRPGGRAGAGDRACTRGRRARSPSFVGLVCGTERDPQNLRRRKRKLREAGLMLASSNAEAVRLAIRIAAGGGAMMPTFPGRTAGSQCRPGVVRRRHRRRGRQVAQIAWTPPAQGDRAAARRARQSRQPARDRSRQPQSLRGVSRRRSRCSKASASRARRCRAWASA